MNFNVHFNLYRIILLIKYKTIKLKIYFNFNFNYYNLLENTKFYINKLLNF